MTTADIPIRTERRGAALWLWLNRPNALNSLTLEMVRGLHRGLDLAADPGVRVVVIAGKGRAFCAGADLSQVLGRVSGDAEPAAEDDFLQQVGAAFDRLEAFEKPVIAAVHGLAVAGGLELVLCCDLVVASRSASFGDAHANYGLLPAGGGSIRLPRRVGPARAKQLSRNNLELCSAGGHACGMAVAVDVVEGLAAKFAALLPHLDERQRRLAMGAEARSLGHGGIKAVAEAAGVSAVTVSAGVAELEAGGEPLGRARAPGGGRKSVTETDPGVVEALLGLVEPGSRGDPESPLRWTTLSLRNLAGGLAAAGHQVSAPTVARLLRQEHFSLQGNAKVAEGRDHADRDAQFRYISEQASAHQAAGQPVVSVDAKKKENVGNFRNGGREWRPKGSPERVKVHDFIDKELGKVTPCGVYDVGANAGWVSVGTDHDTAAFAVQTIRTWWQKAGQPAYPHATRLLICADGGGSNGYRTRPWKTELAGLAAETGLEITVCHFPPGTSKWNKIEHRLFSQISMNWRGRPLTSHEVIVSLIANTRTRTGLTVAAELDPGQYPKGIKISDQAMQALEQSRRLRRHDWHPEWNYCLTAPRPP